MLYPAQGSSLSEVLCDAVAVAHELRAERDPEAFRTRRLPHAPRWQLRELLGGLRHVDDALGFSKVLCGDCVLRGLQAGLPDHIGYGAKGWGPHLQFLHAEVHVRRDGTVWTEPVAPNARYALGLAELQTRARIVPCCEAGPGDAGGTRWPQAVLNSFLKGRLATHAALMEGQGLPARKFRADALVIGELRRLGYPAQDLESVLRSVGPNKADAAVRKLRAALRQDARGERAAGRTGQSR